MSNTKIENFLGSCKVNSSVVGSLQSAITVIAGSDASGTGPYSISNAYAYAHQKNGDNIQYLANYRTTTLTGALTLKNINVVNAGTEPFKKVSSVTLDDPSYNTTYGSSYELSNAAKSFFGADKFSKIWDISNLVENFGNYTPENSPVRNHLYVAIPNTIEFNYNAKEIDVYSKYSTSGNAGIMTVTKLDSDKNYTDVGEYNVHISLGDSTEAKFYTFKDELETLREKDIKVKINKARIYVAGGVLPITETGDLQEGFLLDDTLFNGIETRDLGSAPTKPEFCLEYRKLSSSIWTREKPTISGDYFARACITNPESTNYEIADDGQVMFTVPKKNVAVPYFTGDGVLPSNITGTITTVPYTSSFQTFKLVNSVDGKSLQGVIVTSRSGGISYNKLTGEFKVMSVGTYEVCVELEDGGVNTRWTNYQNVNPERVITIVITKANLVAEIQDASFTSWQKGERDYIYAHVTGIMNNEAVSVTVECGAEGESLEEIASDAIYPEDGNIHITINLAKFIANKKYILKISLKDDVSANKNYNLLTDNTYFEFFILTAVIKNVDASWEYDNIITGKGIKVDASTDIKLSYNSEKYHMRIDEANLPAGVKVNYQYQKYSVATNSYEDVTENAHSNFGKYKTIAVLSAEDGYELSSTINKNISINWEISPKEFKISTLTFSNNPQWNGKRQSVYITNVPDGITVTNLSNSGVAVSNYIATFILEVDDGNYSFVPETDLPSGLIVEENDGTSAIVKYCWQITEAVILVSNSSKDWYLKTVDVSSSVSGKEYSIAVPKVYDTYGNVIKLTYYDENDIEVEDIYKINASEDVIVQYKCKVTLNEFASASSNYIVKNINGTYEASYTFFVGGDKSPINITFDNTEEIFYKNNIYKVNATCDGVPITINSTYYKYNEETYTYDILPDGEFPKEVGVYKVIFSVDGDDAENYTITNSLFEFRIKELVISTSGWTLPKKVNPLDVPTISVYADDNIPTGCYEICYYEEDDYDENFISGTATKLTSPNKYNTNYVAVAMPVGNGSVVFADDAQTTYRFRTGADPNYEEPISIPDPILKESSIEFDINGIEVVISNWSNTQWNLVEIVEGSLSPTSVGVCVVKFKVKDGANAQWEWENGNSTRQVTFEVVTRKINMPIIPAEVYYTGSNIDIKNLITNFDADYMTVSGDVLKKDIGTVYQISISLKDKNNTCWVNDNGLISTDDIGNLEWQIVKGVIEGSLNYSNGYPTLVFSNEDQANFVEIKYLNSQDEKVGVSDFVNNENYKIVISLKDDNFQLSIDGSNTSESSFTKEFTYKKKNALIDDVISFAKDYWLYMAIALAVLILLLIIIGAIKRRKKKKQQSINTNQQMMGMNNMMMPNQIMNPMATGYYPSMFENSLIMKQIEELRQEVKSLTKYNLASEEEKNKNDRLEKVENTLKQFLMSNFANNPNWIPFNDKDMINYDLNDLMQIYGKAKKIVSQNNSVEPKQQIIISDEAENFESKVSEYNKQKNSSQYEELLREIRDLKTENKNIKDFLISEKNRQTEKELEETKKQLESMKQEKLFEEVIKKNEQPPIAQQQIQTPIVQQAQTPAVTTNKTSIEKLEFNDAYQKLPDKQKKYFKDLQNYALTKPNAKIKPTKYNFAVGVGNSPYVKFVIKRNTLIAVFGVTEIKLESEQAFNEAKQAIDKVVSQIQDNK